MENNQHFNTYDEVSLMFACRKKPITIYAKQIDTPFTVHTLEGTHQGKPGDYLMQGVDGELYPCAKAIFEKTYDFL